MKNSILTALAFLYCLVALSQANTTLSNLVSPTAINQSLVPNTSTRDLGSASFRWDDIFVSKVNLANLSLRQGTTTNGNLLLSSSTVTTSSGSRNTMIGFSTGNVLISTSSDNTALGFEAGMSTALTLKSTYLGSKAGRLNTASHCTFIGAEAGRANTTGSENTFVGHYTGAATTTGQANVAIGSLALNSNVSGFGNVAIGQGAASSCTGNSNVIVGRSAGINVSTASGTVALGSGAGQDITTGEYNISIGQQSAENLQTGNFNIAIGFTTGFTQPDVVSSVVIGNFSDVAISNAMVFGNAQQSKWGFGTNLAGATADQALIVGTYSGNGNGAFLTTGGAWTNTSAADTKDHLEPVDRRDILKKVNELELSRWKYKGTNEFHIGPVAEQFHELFNVGVNNKSVSTIDPAGVALVSVQALSEEQESINVKLQQLKEENARLARDLEEMRECVEKLCELQKMNANANTGAFISGCFPNPSDGNTTIRVHNPDDSRVAILNIYSSSGELIMSETIDQHGDVELDLSFASAGIYSASLESNGIVVSQVMMIITK